MASGGKKKTTMAKLNRESKLRERRLDKAARKDARKRAAADEANGISAPLDPETGEPVETAEPDAEQPELETAVAERANG